MRERGGSSPSLGTKLFRKKQLKHVQEFRKARSRALAFFLSKSSDKSPMKKNVLDQYRSSLIAAIPAAKSRHVIENLFFFDLPVSPSDIWPYIADTSRMNKEMGFPPRIEREVNGENYVTTKTLGREEEWIEKPWVWVDESEILSQREFIKGWMTEQIGVFTVAKTDEGCRVGAFFRWSFSNIFSKFLFLSAGGVINKGLKKYFDDKVKVIQGSQLTQDNQNELDEPLEPYDTFLNYLKTTDELELDRLHLKKIAQEIKLPLDLLLEVAHKMVNEGLLTLTWDVVCPHCRGVRSENSGLALIEMNNSCEACSVDFGLEMEESIEVVFRLTDKLRVIPKVVYCAAEPAKKKHIKLSQELLASDEKSFDMKLKDGIYRLRRKQSAEVLYLDVKTDHENIAVWDFNQSKKMTVNNDFKLVVSSPVDTSLILEEAWWFNDRLTPREVLSNALMRTLFSEDHLATGVNLNVGNQVILFTDIVGSTPFYKSQGDAKAFKAVQEHYKEVADIITSHKGVVIKYIGDAIMAAFLDPGDALQTSIKIHEAFSEKRKDSPIKLRVSFHQGPVLCANMNVGLDYFGNTVNQAAKIQKWAGSYEIAITENDWQQLSEKAKAIPNKQAHDEKLNLDVRILNLK